MRGRQMAEFYRTRFQRFVEGVRALEALQDQLVEEETATLGGESWEQCFGRNGRHGMGPTAWIREVAVHIRNRLILQASTEFAPPGSRLDISSEGLNAQRMIEVRGHDAASFDPLALWEELEEIYGGERGAEEAYRQAASTLLRIFGLERKNPVTQAGMVVIDIPVSVDEFSRKHMGRNRLSSYSTEAVAEGGLALQAFLNWAGQPLAGTALAQWSLDWGRGDRELESRKRVDFGPLQVVTFQRRFQYRFSLELARALQNFLARYARRRSAAA